MSNYWLMKSEPSEVSIDDLAALPKQTVAWFGVRNYQARNFMRDDMKVGDRAFFYHSSCAQPGIAGIVEISSAPYADPTQYEPEGHYFDPKSTAEKPRWMLVDVTLIKKIPLLPLSELRQHPPLENMRLLSRGNRLSITPVTAAEWNYITTVLLQD